MRFFCPECNKSTDARCIDSRTSKSGHSVRRRKVCESGHRFSTIEIVKSEIVGVKQKVIITTEPKEFVL